jgi:hypothetical protein
MLAELRALARTLAGWRGVVAVTAFGVVALIGLAGWRLSVAQQQAQTAREHLTAARVALNASSPPAAPDQPNPTQDDRSASRGSTVVSQLKAACTEASAADAALRDLNDQVQGLMPLVAVLEALPGVGQQARTQATSLEAGSQLAAAGSSLCAGLDPLLSLVTTDTAGDNTQPASNALKHLVGARPRLVEALQRFEDLRIALATIADDELDPSSRGGVQALRQRLPQLTGALRDATVFLDLLGASGERRYLLVSQNPDEIRATGGYIGSAGVVSVRGGSVSLLEYGSSHLYDTPPDLRSVPPPPFQTYLRHGYWNLDAANWWASFPDDARQMAYFYNLSHPPQPVDGVVALDQFGLRRLLDVVGPVDVPEYGERVSPDTLNDQMDRYVHSGDASNELGRKQFTAALSTALLQRLLAAPRAQLPGIVQAVRAALDEQHLLVWMADEAADRVFAARRWDGELLRSDGDALMLVDTDVAGTKQSQHVARDAVYEVDLHDAAAPAASLTVTYTNASNPGQRPELRYFKVNYRTWLRIYAPAGATLTRSDGFDGPVSTDRECGRTVFAGEVLIPEGATRQVGLHYALPQTVIANGAYDLLVQQQPGVPPGRINVLVTGPGGQVSRSQLANTSGHHGYWRLQTDGDTARLADTPLPQGVPGGCDQPVVKANPIAPPVALAIPSAHIAAPVVDLGIGDDGQMEAPPTPDVVGWYRMSARAGQPGNTVMSGHVDWGTNTAVFWGLRNLHPGDRISVRGADGVSYVYTVEWNESFPTDAVPVERIVGGSYDSLLTLITCDGLYDRAHQAYLERRVVRARLEAREE